MPKVNRQLSYRRNALMVGSCFTENIGINLKNLYFPVSINPCGILYNPSSIAGCIEFLVNEKRVDASELFNTNGLWNNFSFHSRFSSPDKDSALTAMNQSLSQASNQLRSASHLFLTFGTSWVYREKVSGAIVGNCHKLPSHRFTRQRLTVDEMTNQWVSLLNRLFEVNPGLFIVLTISPVRHLKDGNYENQVSKSALFLLVDQLQSVFGTGKIAYFPSYELVMDELRDYRFYASDMLHLSETATGFVQDKFNGVFLDKESLEISSRIDKIVKSLMHKPSWPENSAYQELLCKLDEEANRLMAQYPCVNFEQLIIDIIQKKGL
jgi:hypothetical protein